MKPRTETDTIIDRINALREHLFGEDLNEGERNEVITLLDHWRMRLAILLCDTPPAQKAHAR